MRRPAVWIAVALLVAGILTFPSAGIAPAAAESSFKVIVHTTVKGSQIQRATLSSIFLKQVPRWSDGSPVRPVDQSMRSPVRLSFAADVLHRPLVEVQLYWSKKMSAGVAPPPVKPTDQEVASYVASTPGAIGYVSRSLALPEGVRPLEIVD